MSSNLRINFSKYGIIKIMPYRKTLLVQDQIYHVFNRGVASLPIFASVKDYSRFLELVDYYRFINTPVSFSHLKKMLGEERKKILSGLEKKDETQIEISAYCLMDNHFHFLLKQLTKSGISRFMANLQNGYAKYFNIKTRRAGPRSEEHTSELQSQFHL